MEDGHLRWVLEAECVFSRESRAFSSEGTACAKSLTKDQARPEGGIA